MLSYVLLPTEQKFTQNFDFVLVHEWIDHRQILHDLREKFPHAQSFAVWSVDSLNIERSPSLLLSSMCLGILNTSRDIFSFVPNPGCGQYYKDKMKGAQIRVGQEYDNKYMRASDYQGLLLSVVTAEINKKSDKSFVRLKNHRLVDPPDLENSVCLLLSDNFKPSEKSVCLIFEDDSCRTVWHRLCDLDLSNQLITERKIYYLSRHPNNIDLELQSISLIPVKHSGKTDQVAAEQDREYHFSLLLDTLRDDKSSEENCRKAASSVYEVQEYKMKFEFSDPNEIACKILAYVIRTGGRLADSPDETSNNELFRTFPSDVKGVLFKKLDLTSLAKLSVVNHELTDAAWKNRFRDYFPWLYQQKLQEGMTNWRSEFIASYKKALTGIKDHEELQSLFDAIGDKSISQLKKVLRFKTFDEKNLFIRKIIIRLC